MKPVTRILLASLIPVVALAAYHAYTIVSPSPYYPPIKVIAKTFQEMWLFGHLASDVLPSLGNLLLGYVSASLAGLVVGTLLGRVRTLRMLFEPLLDFGRSIPAIMLIPPLVLILGIGDAGKIAIIAVGAFFPVALATTDGMARIEPTLIDVCKVLDLNAWQRTVVVWLPSAAPSIAGGMQTGLQFALVLMVSSEMVAATKGIGFLTMQAQYTFDAPRVWAGMALLAILGFALNASFVVARNRLLRWHVDMHAINSR